MVASYYLKELREITENQDFKEYKMDESKKSFINTYLDSPIIRNDRDKFFLAMLQVRAGETPKIHSSSIRKAKELLQIIGKDDVECLEPELYHSFDLELVPKDYTGELKEAEALSRKVFDQADKGARGWGLTTGLGVGHLAFEDLDPHLLRWYNCHRQFRVFIDLLSCGNAAGMKGLVKCRSGNIFFCGDQYLGVIKIDDVSKWYLVSFEQVLMFKDMYYARFNAMYACQQIYRSPSLQSTMVRCLDWFMKCVSVYGNKGYEVGKSIEALAKANLIRKYDPILGENGSYVRMLETVREKEKKFGKRDCFLADELDLILREDRPAEHAVEIFGLQKLTGHPLIDPSVGGESVVQEARTKIKYKSEDIKLLRNNFCRLYTEGYVRRNSEWPPLAFPAHRRHTKLYQLYSLRELKINVDSYDIKDWEEVKFMKHHDFEYYPNFTDLVDDRSISYYRDEVAATWNHKMKTRSQKRLLLEMLDRPEINIKTIVDRVRVGDIPYSWLIVSLYPKEREFKIAARMFSMMVFEMRFFFTVTEANLADHVFPNLPQQTMTLPKQEIQEMFHKITHEADGEDLERLYLEVDLTRWNLRWHPEPINPIGYDLEDMFGLPGVYTAVHFFFRSCMILVRVAACEPEEINLPHPKETSLLWYDHEVGFEGIAQKLWTCATYSMIDLGLRGFTGRYYLIGQGDNQIILTTIDCASTTDRKEYLKTMSERVAQNINDECLKVGQEAKPDECLQSTTVVTYSKDVYINGVEYFTSIKAASRMFPHSASDFPSIDSSIGALSGQAIAAAERMKNPMNAFVLWCFHTALYLTHVSTMSPVETLFLSQRFYEKFDFRAKYGLMVLPGELGGCPIAPITAFFYKGGADPLSKAYASLKFYQESSPLVRKFSYALLQGTWFEKEPERTQLLDDPYGLPFSRPVTAETSVARQSKEKVHTKTVNRELKALTHMKVDKYEEELSALLLKCEPFNPVLLSDVLGWSIVGAKKTISRMFTSTRTVQALLQSKEESSPCHKILVAGTGHFLNTVERIRNTTVGDHKIVSIYKDVNKLRAYWSKKDEPKIEGVTSYTPFDLPLVISQVPFTGQGFKMHVDVSNKRDPLHCRGGSDPYLGKKTQEKRADHGYKITTSSAPERAVKKLADIATQPGVHESFKRLISEVAQSRADVDLNQVYAMIGSAIGGTIAHRYGSRLGLRSASGLGSMSFASNCTLSNDTADPISGGERDVPIMVQENMVLEITVGILSMSYDSSSLFITLVTGDTEWDFLDDTELRAPEKIELPHLRLENNRIATADQIMLQRTHGPQKSPLASEMLAVGTSRIHHKYAVRRMIHRALSRAHSALAIADQGSGTIHFKIDILELRGCGAREVLREMSKEVACIAIETVFARSNGEVRWTPLPLIASISEALARSIYMLFLHPMFKNDPFILKYLYPSPLQYTFSGQSILKKVRDCIAQDAVKMIADSTSDIFTSPEILYQDDGPDSVSRAIIRRLKIICYQSMITSECSTEIAYDIIRKTLPATIRSEHEETGRLSALYRMAAGLATWAAESAKFNMREHYVSLYTGRSVRYCDVAAQEMLREARQVTINLTIAEGYRSSIRDDGIEDSEFLPTVESDEDKLPFNGLGEGWGGFKTDHDMFSFRRMIGRIYGADSSAGYSYDRIRHLCFQRVCAIIGCGFGSGAAVLLHAGASHIMGLDLWSDVNPKNAMDNQMIPPAIASGGYSAYFTRILTRPDCSGDITDASTIPLIQTYCGQGSLYIIDAPLSTELKFKACLRVLSLLPGEPEILYRFVGARSDWDILYGGLSLSFKQVHTFLVYDEPNFVEGWIYFIVSSVFQTPGLRIIHPSTASHRSVGYNDLSYLGGGSDYLHKMIEGPYYDLSLAQIEGGASSAERLIAASIGDLEHRFTYKQWTEVISIYVARYCLESPNVEEEVRRVLEREVISITIDNRNVPVNVTGKLRRLLTRVLPRLL